MFFDQPAPFKFTKKQKVFAAPGAGEQCINILIYRKNILSENFKRGN